MKKIKKRIEKEIKDSAKVKLDLISQTNIILEIITKCSNAISNGNMIFLFGNGGSAADAQHIAAELIGIFSHKIKRSALPAIALTTNTSILTAVGNDISFDDIFARQIEGLVRKGDVTIGISTSGESKNVINAMKKAKKLGAITIAFSGKNKSNLSRISNITLHVPSTNTQRIQEAHITVGHLICGIIESQVLAK